MKSAGLETRTDFVLLEANWTGEFATRVLQASTHETIIVHRLRKDEEYYYVFPRFHVERMLAQYPPMAPVVDVLNLHEWSADPRTGPGQPAPQGRAAVVLDDGQLVGFAQPEEGAQRSADLESKPRTPRLEKRNLRADFPSSLVVGKQATLKVYLSKQKPPRGATGLAVEQPQGTQLDVVVQARRGLEVLGDPAGKLVIGAPDEFEPLRFQLRATEAGDGDARVIVFRDGAVIGYLKLSPSIVASARGLHAGESKPVSFGGSLADVQVETPDLSLHIEEQTAADGRRGFSVYLSARDASLNLNLKKIGPMYFQSDPGPFFGEFYRGIEGLPLTSMDDMARAGKEVEARGVFLFEQLFPQEAQELLWSLRDRIKTVFVQSSEPWVPWELCRMTGEEGGRKVEGPFFCEAFEMTRWLPGTGIQPALRLSKMAVVVPEGSGLPYSASEAQFLLELAGGQRQVSRVPARYLPLFEAFSAGQYDGWHFSGHGAVRGADPNKSEMLLEQQETLTPLRISGQAANLGLSHPLVFLNACQIGAGGMSLTDIGGWARQFIAAGAGAFIGAHWAIYDRTSYFFAKELYTRLLAGLPVGKAVREARLAVKPAGDSTWLAYTVFAHPLAKVMG